MVHFSINKNIVVGMDTMGKASEKRERLVQSARKLIHKQGFYRTTLADIASDSKVPLGNVYYYFKTKDEIAEAVIEKRTEDLRSQAEQWEQDPDIKHRLNRFLDMVESRAADLANSGGPTGSLPRELGKEQKPLSEIADGTLQWQVNWATEQFQAISNGNALDLGHQFVANIHGAILLAQSLRSPEILVRQFQNLREWIQKL